MKEDSLSRRAPKKPAKERRATIIKGASAVFAASSYAEADTSGLAAAAGVKPSALYRYFSTKRDLYLATLADAGPRLLALWEQALASSADPGDAIWNIGLAYYDHANSRSPVMRLWFQAVGESADPEVRAIVGQTLGGAVGLITKTIEEGQATGRFRADVDARTAAWHFMGIGFSMDLVFQLGFEDELSRDKVEAWGRLFLESLLPREDAAARSSRQEETQDE